MSDWEVRAAKVETLLKAMAADSEGLAVLKAALNNAGLSMFHQIRPENFPAVTDPDRRANARTGIILDTETTGLDPQLDEVIQLSMQKILFDEKGIIDVGEVFDRMRQPSNPIPAEITTITGITNDMVEGKAISDIEVAAFLDGTEICIAYNSAFDRKFCETSFPAAGFDIRPWFCAWKEIDWKARSPGQGSLENLLLREGYVYGSHNAMNDVHATAFLLTRSHEGHPDPFAEMLETGQRDVILVIAKGSPFEKKDDLKARGYSFTRDGAEAGGYENSWYVEVPAEPGLLEDEGKFLKEIFRRDMTLPAFRSGPMERYSDRKPAEKVDFKTFEAKTLSEKMELPQSHPEFSF